MRHESVRRSTGVRRSRRKGLALRSPAFVEQRLAGILKDLASLLVANGYGIAGLSKLAKRAYLDAAVALERDESQRRNKARIAAQTGLTRNEVTRLSRRAPSEAAYLPVSRAQRVSLGWISDANYCDSYGKPKVLAFGRNQSSFNQLVKRYSGDIPARAMLSEMLRLGMAREVEGKCIRLVRADSPVSRRTLNTLSAISPWVSFLAEADSDTSNDLKANMMRITLDFDSLPQLFSQVRDLQDRAQAFVQSIKEMGARKKAKRAYKLHVSFALATRVPRVDAAPSKRR